MVGRDARRPGWGEASMQARAPEGVIRRGRMPAVSEGPSLGNSGCSPSWPGRPTLGAGHPRVAFSGDDSNPISAGASKLHVDSGAERTTNQMRQLIQCQVADARGWGMGGLL